jgi:hypothetical protein
MSAGSISLTSSVRSCKIDTAWAPRIESDRFLNPDNMVCPVWNGFDTAGRSVCPDSFYTKRRGCNSAEDRVIVENNQRPQYAEYITLSAAGINADIYSPQDVQGYDQNKDMMNWNREVKRTIDNNEMQEDNPHFGVQFGAHALGSCNSACSQPYETAMAQERNAKMGMMNQMAQGNGYRQNSGMGCGM